MRFDCILDTARIPKSWVRENETSEDASNPDYAFGQCVDGVCAHGAAKGSHCDEDQHCDVIQKSESFLHKVTSHILPKYIKPKYCHKEDKQFDYSLYQYCGKTPDGRFTGVCRKDEHDKSVCTTFKSVDEINTVNRAEMHHLAQIPYDIDTTHHQNFYPEGHPPWRMMRLCREDERVRGHCKYTMEKAETPFAQVEAGDDDEALEQCRMYDLPEEYVKASLSG